MPPGDGVPRRARVLLVGDSGVGKSLLLHRLLQASLDAASGHISAAAAGSGGGAGGSPSGTSGGQSVASSPALHALSALPAPTVGVAVDASMLPGDAGGGAIEWLDLGGNRGFGPATRAPYYADVDAVVLVYRDSPVTGDDAAADATLQSLYFWAEELIAGGVLPNAPFLVVGTKLRRNSGASATTGGRPPNTPLTPSSQAVDASGAAGVTAAAARRMLSKVRAITSRVTLLALSFALFGPAQTAVPLETPPGDLRGYFSNLGQRHAAAGTTASFGGAVQHHGDAGGGGFHGWVRGVVLDDAPAFARSSEELTEFVSTVAARRR